MHAICPREDSQDSLISISEVCISILHSSHTFVSSLSSRSWVRRDGEIWNRPACEVDQRSARQSFTRKLGNSSEWGNLSSVTLEDTYDLIVLLFRSLGQVMIKWTVSDRAAQSHLVNFLYKEEPCKTTRFHGGNYFGVLWRYFIFCARLNL